MWILVVVCSLQVARSQGNSTQLIPKVPYSGISSVYSYTNNAFYYFSGIDRDGSFISGLQTFYNDQTFRAWRYSEKISPDSPAPRSNYGSFLYNNLYYIFGGIGENAIFNDMWYYDFEIINWKSVDLTQSITPRYNFAFTSFNDSRNVLYFAVLGGKSYSNSISLLDFYLYRPDTNRWTQQTDYAACSNMSLTGAQLQYNNGYIYLFSGLITGNYSESYYTSICSYNIASKTWLNHSVSKPNFNSSQGGSCVYEDFIYSFFGWSLVNGSPLSVASMTYLDLSNINAGWTPVNISDENCTSSTLAINSFGFSCVNNQVYINGGRGSSGPQSSIISIFFNKSKPILECDIDQSQKLWPRKRHESSMVYVTGGMYLFGGIEQGVIMNDLWFFNITNGSWTELKPSGSIPSPRYGHASASQGNYIIIVGGMTYNDEYVNDYFYYRTDKNSWYEIVASSDSIIPPQIYRTCAVFAFPVFYYVGGKEQSQVTLSIWQFNFTDSLFKQLYTFNSSIDTPIYQHRCFLLPTNDSSTLIAVGPGSISIDDIPSCSIKTFNLSAVNISAKSLNLTGDSSFLCRTDSIFQYIGYNSSIVAGGQDFRQEVFYDIWVINFTNSISFPLGYLDYPIYSAATSFLNQTLYIYSGLSDSGASLYFSSSDYFQQIILDPGTSKLSIPCGQGLNKTNTICNFCPPGSYNSIENDDSCSPCPAGTYNPYEGATDLTQCVPCSFGNQSNASSANCTPCKKDDTCYIGTGAYPISKSVNGTLTAIVKSSSQPGIYRPPNISREKIILYIVTACLIGVLIFAFLFSLRIKMFLSYYDLYKDNHVKMVKEDGQAGLVEEDIKPSLLGGICSGITIIIVLYLTANAILIYAKINYSENIVLVPIDSLLKEKSFSSEKFEIGIYLPSYGDNCAVGTVITNLANFSSQVSKVNQTVRFDAICNYTTSFETNELSKTGETIQFEFTEPFGFTSDIYISLKSDSSIPGEISKVVQNISSDIDYVFRGNDPTVFTFSILPSLYSHVDLIGQNTDYLGYRLSSTILPVRGSQSTIDNIAQSSSLKIKVVFLRSEIGITTFRYPTITPIEFFFNIINSFPGTIGIVGAGLWLAEYFNLKLKGVPSRRYQLFKEKYEEEKKKREEQRKNKKTNKKREKKLHEDKGGVSINRGSLSDSFT